MKHQPKKSAAAEHVSQAASSAAPNPPPARAEGGLAGVFDPAASARAEQILDRLEKAQIRHRRWSEADPGDDPLRIKAIEQELPSAEQELRDATEAFQIARGDRVDSSEPSSKAEIQKTAGSKVVPVQRFKAQDEQILEAIKARGHDPHRMPKSMPGKSGVRAETKKALGTTGIWSGKSVFRKAWERLTTQGDIAYSPTPAGTPQTGGQGKVVGGDSR